jgi:hypothetical protein
MEATERNNETMWAYHACQIRTVTKTMPALTHGIFILTLKITPATVLKIHLPVAMHRYLQPGYFTILLMPADKRQKPADSQLYQ